jgi:FG-GAP-like repeat/Divergent InlB B-repeat domain
MLTVLNELVNASLSPFWETAGQVASCPIRSFWIDPFAIAISNNWLSPLWSLARMRRLSSPDLAVGQVSGNGVAGILGTIIILLGKGDGTFQPPIENDTSFPVNSIALGDLNSDGRLDIVAATGWRRIESEVNAKSEGAVSILVGNGDGTFQSAVNYGPATQEFLSITMGDFNGDGKLDIAVAGSDYFRQFFHLPSVHDGQVSVFLGNGDGTFAPENTVQVGSRDFFLTVGDLNRDGKLDVAVLVGENSASLGVLLGNGDGTLQVPTLYTAGSASSSVDLGDLNGNKLPDLAVTNSGDNSVSVMLNTGIPTTAFTLSITDAGSGTGTVSSDPPGIQCGAVCSASFASRTTVTLNAVAEPYIFASVFTGWSGSCSGVSTCSVVMNADKSVTANFVQSQTLSVTLTGNGSGSVTSNPGGSSCTNAGGSCSARLATGTAVSLTAVPSGNSVFAGWSGACTGTDPNTCAVTLTSNQSVTATFNTRPDFTISPASQNLTVKRGSQASDGLTIVVQSGFSGSIALACSVSGPSPMPACGISPVSVPPGTNATLTVNAAALTAAVTSRPFERAETLFATVLPLGLMGLALTMCFDKKPRKFWTLPLLMLLATILPAACGGSSNSPPPPQKYTVTVTAQSGAIQHLTTVSVTVN